MIYWGGQGRSRQEDDMLPKTEESEGVNIMEIWEKYVLVRRNSMCKGPEVEVCLGYSKNSREGRVAGVDGRSQA